MKPVERNSIEPAKFGETSKPKIYSAIKRPAEGGQNGNAQKKFASAFLVSNTQATPMSAKDATTGCGAPPVRISVPHTATPVIQPQQITRVARAMQQFQQQPGLSLKPPPINQQKPNHPNTPLGSARNAFETKVYSGLEVCHQISGKINTLTNNSSYKDVRHYKDLKELYIHLNYLLTYAIGRFKSVQDNCNEELQKLGYAIAAEERKDGEDYDLEIVEQQTSCIELDSDDEGTGEKEKKKEDEVPDPDKDPKLKLKVSVAIKRVETIIPSVAELLKALHNTDSESTGEKEKEKEDEVPDPDKDPKLKLKVSVAINRVETIIPSVVELLKALDNTDSD